MKKGDEVEKKAERQAREKVEGEEDILGVRCATVENG